MKRFISLFLAFLMILAVCPVLTVSGSQNTDIKWLAKYSTEAEAQASFTDNKGAYITTTNVGDNQIPAGADVTKLSNYAVRWGSPWSSAAKSFQFPGPVDTKGYTHLNFWFYAKSDFATRVYLSDSYFYAIGFYKGWNLVSLPLPTGMESFDKMYFHCGTLTAVIPEGLPNAGVQFTKQPTSARHYVDSMWLSKKSAVNEFSPINIKDGNSQVITNIGSLRINAPGLVESSIADANVTVEYCLEGTHDEGNHSVGTLSAGTDFSLDYEEDTLIIQFENELLPDTTYNVKLEGAQNKGNFFYSGGYVSSGSTYTPASGEFAGEMEMPFASYSMSFRTLAEGENVPPEVSISNLTKNQRFFPGDNITISAEASDINGTVEKVEFYADDNLIGTVTESPYEFVWENAQEETDGYTIVAKAYDNDGDVTESAPVSILVMELKNPVVTISEPTENDIVLRRNFSGVNASTSVDVKAEVACPGATVESVEFVLDGEVAFTTTQASTSYSYTFENIAVGEHEIYIRATDNYGMQGESEIINVAVKDFGKRVPAILEEDFEKYADGDAVDWTTSSDKVSLTAAELVGNKAAKLATKAAGDVSASKRYRNSLSGSAWEADVRVRFSDTTHERSVILSGESDGAKIVFKSGGDIFADTKDSTLNYKQDEWYEVRIIVDPDSNTLYALIDDTLVLTKTGLTDTYSRNGATIKVTQTGNANQSGYVLFDDAGIYKLEESSIEATGITLYNGGAPVADTTTTPLSTDSFSVSLTEGTGSSLENNVWVLDTEENRKISLTYKDNKVFFNEMLRGNRAYSVVVSTGVSSDSSQTTIAKSGVFTFTTAPADADVTGATFKIDGSEVDALPDTVTAVSCELPFVNNSGETHEMEIVAVVYNGDKMTNIAIQPWTVTTATDTLAVTVPVTGYTPNTRIEVFVVDDMENMTPISDTIFQIK